jgi:hypothetical protein
MTREGYPDKGRCDARALTASRLMWARAEAMAMCIVANASLLARGGGSSASHEPPPPGILSDAGAGDLTAEQRAELCDWAVMQVGGYGAT